MGALTLHLGCGPVPMPNAVNVDKIAIGGVDVVHDLDVTPWPFDAGQFQEVKAQHLFEHVADPVAFMAECWRVLRPGGLLLLRVPHYQSEQAYTDPTHVRFCTLHTFDYWCRGTDLYHQYGSQMARGGYIYDYEIRVVTEGDVIAVLRKVVE
ncbi:MAG: methyltransferase domain-containing protein [Microthrixaceae bacterium]